MSVGMKRECSLFLKSSFLPSKIISEERAIPDTSQFFFSQKQAAHRARNHKLYITAQKYELVNLPAHFSGFHHLHMASSSRPLLLEWSIGHGPWWSQCYLFRLKFKKTMSQILIDSNEERKEHPVLTQDAMPKPQGQQIPPAVCQFSSLSLKEMHNIHGENLFWYRSHKVNVYPVFLNPLL